MLGRRVADPEGFEGPPGAAEGLGLLDIETDLIGTKVLCEVTGETVADRAPFGGYEMHIGRTRGPGAARPMVRFADGREDGAVSADGRVAGCYVHGLFADDRQRAAWIARLGGAAGRIDYEATLEETLDELAAHMERHVDLDRLLRLAAPIG
jgi:adenosylcobyric acid synthase